MFCFHFVSLSPSMFLSSPPPALSVLQFSFSFPFLIFPLLLFDFLLRFHSFCLPLFSSSFFLLISLSSSPSLFLLHSPFFFKLSPSAPIFVLSFSPDINMFPPPLPLTYRVLLFPLSSSPLLLPFNNNIVFSPPFLLTPIT